MSRCTATARPSWPWVQDSVAAICMEVVPHWVRVVCRVWERVIQAFQGRVFVAETTVSLQIYNIISIHALFALSNWWILELMIMMSALVMVNLFLKVIWWTAERYRAVSCRNTVRYSSMIPRRTRVNITVRALCGRDERSLENTHAPAHFEQGNNKQGVGEGEHAYQTARTDKDDQRTGQGPRGQLGVGKVEGVRGWARTHWIRNSFF